ncbi:glycine oxidase ThiO [Aliihoeflea sp. 2WW]|uniref:glycine oxidase ThiO n=1 Tax=Aliihoeflea sp. 2WW TaxID=1381123 RepID=UPI0004A4D110|nr:glycine oxidase ThiO [Aliihoeflea sp. 2WW]
MRTPGRVLVRGGGVAGLCAAHELHAHGFAVELVERQAEVGAGASGLAGGMLAPYCERESAPEDVLRLGRHASDWWNAVLPGHVVCAGTLVVAPPRDAGELARFAARTEGYEWLDEAGIAALEPSLEGRFRKGLFFREEAHLDPRAALLGLSGRLKAQGVRLHFGATEPPTGRFDHVVDCTGAAAIGAVPGLRGVRGEMLCLETAEVALARPVRLLHPRHPLYIVPRGGGRFMVGATMIESDDAGPISARSLMELLNAAYALHPAFGEARLIEARAGIRPAFDDNLPRVIRDGGTIFVNGFYRHGFLLAPATARQAAHLMQRKAA